MHIILLLDTPSCILFLKEMISIFVFLEPAQCQTI
jgi:hypothetical protein